MKNSKFLIDKLGKLLEQGIISTGSVSSYPMKTPLPLKEKNLWDGYPEEINASYGIAKRLIHSQSLSYKKQYIPVFHPGLFR